MSRMKAFVERVRWSYQLEGEPESEVLKAADEVLKAGNFGEVAKCNKCGMEIQSMHRHNFVWCSCRSVAIDGGKDYTKMTGNGNDWELLEPVSVETLRKDWKNHNIGS